MVREDGPQYRQLAQETQGLAETDRATVGYLVTTKEESVLADEAPEAVVRAKITWSRPSETAQEYEWEVVLHRAEGDRWQLWTIRDSEV